MGFVATDLGRIPGRMFSWYVFVLLDDWEDELQKEVEQNFEKLAIEVGPDTLVVRGSDPEQFYNDLIDSSLMELADPQHREPALPALVVANLTPRGLDETGETVNEDDTKLMIFPLSDRYLRPGSITDFLRTLARTLRENQPEKLSPDALKTKWDWITRYFDLKPNFFGMGVDFDQVIDDLFSKRDSSIH